MEAEESPMHPSAMLAALAQQESSEARHKTGRASSDKQALAPRRSSLERKAKDKSDSSSGNSGNSERALVK